MLAEKLSNSSKLYLGFTLKSRIDLYAVETYSSDCAAHDSSVLHDGPMRRVTFTETCHTQGFAISICANQRTVEHRGGGFQREWGPFSPLPKYKNAYPLGRANETRHLAKLPESSR